VAFGRGEHGGDASFHAVHGMAWWRGVRRVFTGARSPV
jgi:hypothetical protein